MRNKLASLWYTEGNGSFRAPREASAVELGFMPGVLVRSMAGRDLGHCYAVTAVIDYRRVLVADGLVRPISRPKVKNVKHLMILPQQSHSLAERLTSGQRVRDDDLQLTLQAAGCGSVANSEAGADRAIIHGAPSA